MVEVLSASVTEGLVVKIEDYKALVGDLRWQWKTLWRERIDDRVRAEGIASRGFPDLFVDRGTVIIATRDYKPLSFREILEAHLQPDMAEVVDPNPSRGGIRKFIKKVIVKREGKGGGRRLSSLKPKLSMNQQLKKGGRGWLHCHI